MLTDVFSTDDRRRPLGLAVIFLIFVFPVLLIAALSYLSTQRDLSATEYSRKQSIAYLTATIVKEKLDRMVDIGLSLSTRVRFRQLVVDANWQQAIEILAEVPKDFPFIERVFLSDPEGNLMADRPELPGVVGKNFAHRDWYQGVSKNWRPYISEVYQRAAEPKYNVIAISVPVTSQETRRVHGILVLQIPLDMFLEWTRNIEVGPSGFVYFVDRKGQLIAHPNFPPQEKIVDFLDVPVVQKVLRGERGIDVQVNPIEKEERIAAFEPVPGYGWGVVATQPTATAFAPQKAELKRLVVVYGFIILLSAFFAYVIFSAMAERKTFEEQLERKNRELKQQSLRVEEASRLKSEFLANMSHELRTPLNGIIGFAEMMHDARLGPVSEQHKEYLGDILTSAEHLLKLINDVLDLSKVEAGRMEFHPESLSLEKLARETCDIVRTLSARKRLKLETHIDPETDSVALDPAKLKQVLYNYLSNAIKFTPDGGRITVRAAPESANEFRLEVEDTGAGIKPEDMGKLFTEFQQLHAPHATEYKGTGLGLALTKKIVEAQGGRVGVSSVLGQGSVFFAVLPRRFEPAGARVETAEAKPAPATEPGRPTILVIEDDPKDQSWLVESVVGAGYNVEVAGNGTKALALCSRQTFDAITLDLMLPDMNGWDLLRKLRNDSLNQATPVIVVTVIADKAAAVGYRIEEFLTKPVTASDLIAAMKRIGIVQGRSQKILCIDDDPHSLKLAETALHNASYAPLCHIDAQDALRWLKKERPAAVILDLLMPGMDGFEFLERFHRIKDTHRIPILVWTVKDLTNEDRSRLQASVQAIVTKGPNGTAQLLEELGIHIGLAASGKTAVKNPGIRAEREDHTEEVKHL
ncbi:MAG TPA: response regulator [Candidatus Binatia bacterium]